LSQGDSHGVSFTARSYDLARPGVAPPLVDGLSVISFHLYSAADMSTALLITQQTSLYEAATLLLTSMRGQHRTVLQETASSLKPSSRVSSVQRVDFREDIAAAKGELLSASEH